ncbi:PHP domain-containing protein [Glaciihabitans arcticus]|uniref:PHP domain-containing protein n=1 Tax=Glaciihabitans arcticus TaxID=2668039 RepID=A0A4Q9GQZ1_9MICO|nr:PHP domain-containing protein [Glaciihabitans arcticus]TBN57302.1 PHP domain-containing protein [Glaciihabitans arcticus]
MELLQGDFHVHSTFSDDAVSTVAENIAVAAERGLTTLRLIDHVRVSTDWVPEFVAAVAAETIPEGLTVLTGVETKILDSRGTLDLPPDLAVGEGGVDGIVLADHQFPGPNGPWSPTEATERLAAGLGVEDALDLLVSALVAGMNGVASSWGHGVGQLAHCFSILPKIGLSESQLSKAQLTRWAAAAAETGTLIEINEKWGCPEPRSIAAARAAGATIVAASDAHRASDVGRYEAVQRIHEQSATGDTE